MNSSNSAPSFKASATAAATTFHIRRPNWLRRQSEFDKQIERARSALAPVTVVVPNFKPSDTEAKDGEMAKFGKMLNDKAAELSGQFPRLAPICTLPIQGAATDCCGVRRGRKGLEVKVYRPFLLGSSSSKSPHPCRPLTALLALAVTAAKNAIDIAIKYFEKQQDDSKFRLKAAGAHWHNENLTGPSRTVPYARSC